MDKGILKYENSEIHFLRFGAGEELLIALHGFADKAAMFLKLEESLKTKYVVYCLDLPFHGATKWNKPQFDQEDISCIFKVILKKENKERFDLMGFSLGGRIVQKMLFEWIPKVNKVYLIAPDGLDTKWFNASMVPQWFKSSLKWLLRKPEWFIKTIKHLHKWGLITRFIHNFTYYHIHTKEKRDRIFSVWYSLRYFRINVRKVKNLLRKYPIPIELYFGSRDEVIPASTGILLAEGMPNIRLHEIEEGHLLIDHKLNDLLKRQLSNT